MLKFRLNYRRIITIFLTLTILSGFFNIYVSAADDESDLTITYISYDETVNEDDYVKVSVRVTNAGEKNVSVGEKIEATLRINSVKVSTNSTYNGLEYGESCFLNLSWNAELGSQTKQLISVEVDFNDLIDESNENNNDWDGFIYVSEKDTDLSINNVDVVDTAFFNETVNILAEVINTGKSSNESISAKLKANGEGTVETVTIYNVLDKDETHVFSFNWTPKVIGRVNITVEVYYDNVLHDSLKKDVFVHVNRLSWWNSSWHYRYFLRLTGNGNASLMVNFTEFLNDLDVFGKTFENDTISIVEYSKNGDLIDRIDLYNFNESDSFDPVTNSEGVLSWNITNTSFEKFYCIYFDVDENIGNRTVINESLIFNISEDISIDDDFVFIDGWWLEVLQPFNNSYSLIDKSVNISVNSVAKADKVSAFIYYQGNVSNNFTLDLSNYGQNISWYYDNFFFNEEGNWTIIIDGFDKAGYVSSTIEYNFYVGKPDLEIVDILWKTNYPETSPLIYVNDTVNITGKVVSHNANVEDVKVSLEIFYVEESKVFMSDSIILPIVYKDVDNLAVFSWKANRSGVFNFTIIVDTDDGINESNESNNKMTESTSVYSWPDLEITDIFISTLDAVEFDEIEFEIMIENNANTDAYNYLVRLFIEPASNEIMTYTQSKDSKYFSVPAKGSKKVVMNWDSAVTGSWIVGAKIIVNDTKKDTNILNNRLLSNYVLKVSAVERSNPDISYFDVDPNYPDIGDTVIIEVDVSDVSGLKNVEIKITDPDYNMYHGFMVRTAGDTFRYDFKNTDISGEYEVEIYAEDNSILDMQSSETFSFTVGEDFEKPVISYFTVDSYVQLNDLDINFLCIAYDNVEIKDVFLFVVDPDGEISSEKMITSAENKYTYKDTYKDIGMYSYYVKVIDSYGNFKTSNQKSFWTTTDINDTDDDGMPNWWEQRYKLNPENPDDAKQDKDKDGINNIKEYEEGFNPSKDLFNQNIGYRLNKNTGYITGSIALFIIILIISLIEIKRRRD